MCCCIPQHAHTIIYSTYFRRRSQERVASALVSPQPATQCGSAQETTEQGGYHDVPDPQSISAAKDAAEPLSRGKEAMGKGWCISPSAHSSTAYVRVKSLGNGVSVFISITYRLGQPKRIHVLKVVSCEPLVISTRYLIVEITVPDTIVDTQVRRFFRIRLDFAAIYKKTQDIPFLPRFWHKARMTAPNNRCCRST